MLLVETLIVICGTYVIYHQTTQIATLQNDRALCFSMEQQDATTYQANISALNQRMKQAEK